MEKRIALQLYSVREYMEKDLWGTLQKVKDCGYNAVEFAGYYGYSAKELKEGLEELGLEPLSSHVQFDLMRDAPDDVAEFSKELGLSFVVCPAADVNSVETLKASEEVFRRMAGLLEPLGIGFGYHNHDFEFGLLEDGRRRLDVLLEQGKDYGLLAEIDTCWAEVGGVNAADYIRELGDQAGPLHFKDLKEGYDPSKRDVDTVLGTGVVDFPKIIEDGEASGILSRGVVVEQEGFEGDPFDELKAAVDYIHSIWQAQGA